MLHFAHQLKSAYDTPQRMEADGEREAWVNAVTATTQRSKILVAAPGVTDLAVDAEFARLIDAPLEPSQLRNQLDSFYGYARVPFLRQLRLALAHMSERSVWHVVVLGGRRRDVEPVLRAVRPPNWFINGRSVRRMHWSRADGWLNVDLPDFLPPFLLRAHKRRLREEAARV